MEISASFLPHSLPLSLSPSLSLFSLCATGISRVKEARGRWAINHSGRQCQVRLRHVTKQIRSFCSFSLAASSSSPRLSKESLEAKPYRFPGYLSNCVRILRDINFTALIKVSSFFIARLKESGAANRNNFSSRTILACYVQNMYIYNMYVQCDDVYLKIYLKTY